MGGEWRKVRLGDACEKIGSGATPRGGNESYKASGISLIRSQNVYNEGFKRDRLAFIDEQQAAELENVTLKSGDVLLNITGDSVARCCQVPNDVLPARVNQHVAIIRPKADSLDARYLRYFLVSPNMQGQMLAFASAGATRNALTKGMIESFEIPAPPLPTQRAIAAILGALDDKIELNRRMNRTLEGMAQTLFKQWFVDGAEEGWEVGRLGDVAENIRHGAQPSEIEPDTPYIGLEHMPRRSIALTEWGQAEEVTSNKFWFKRGEILFGKLRPYFHKVGVAPIDGVCSTDILVIAPKSPEWFGLSLAHLSSDALIAHTNTSSTGTKMPRTNWEDIARYEILVPPIEMAQAFNRQILTSVEKICANIFQSRTLAALRDTLLPKLISGEVRVVAQDAE
jgi:type I restriction enzyme S subunit